MSLMLRLMSSGTLPDGRNTIEMVDGALTIGRGDENDLALPDPDRLLSKRHCVLEERNGDYVILDISTNGTFLNYGAERLGNIPTPLNNGDVIQLGTFELVVEIASAHVDPRAADPLPPADDSLLSPGMQAPENAASCIEDPLGDVSDPWDDFGGDPLADPTPSGKRASWEGMGIPEDPFADDPSTSDAFLDDAPLQQDDPFAFSAGASEPDHRPMAQDHFAAPSINSPLIPDDWDDLGSDDDPFGSAQPQQPAQENRPTPPMAPPPHPMEPLAETLPESPLEQPLDPLSAPAPQPAPPPVQPAPPPMQPAAPAPAPAPQTPPATVAGSNAAARAFLEAAGAANLSVPEEELTETMARLGRVFAAMVAGMREILMARASIKSEMRMNRTMISTGGNNPLKFSISAEQAVDAMIRPSVRGYLDAETATTEALNDIRAHEIAMMSGMEAALKDLLARLGPDKLSARIESGSTLGSLLGGKKARYWEAYEKMYAQIAKETEDDFQSTFGREFARAYEEQLQKL